MAEEPGHGTASGNGTAQEDGEAPGDRAHPRSDMGRRIRARREELGLTREEAAALAGAAPGYLEYVEEQRAAPGIGFLLRLAHALNTTAGQLLGGTAQTPPGGGRAGPRPQLVPLEEAECRRLLGGHGVGRIAVCVGSDPQIVPVNYLTAGRSVAFRTAPGALPAAARDRRVAFEVDRVDDAMSQGWSVLVVGTARAAGERRARELHRLAFTGPWAGGERDLWLEIEPDRITGRRVTTAAGPP